MHAENRISYDLDRYLEHVQAAASAIRAASEVQPRAALILGSGLGGLVRDMDIVRTLPYVEIPYFPLSTVESHAGMLHLGRLEGVPVMVFQGRFHLYEGYSPWEVTFPVRVAGALGVEVLLISNAAGGLDATMERGDLMLITDHINLQGVNPLTGPNLDAWGPRFPDMSDPYDRTLCLFAEDASLEMGIRLHQGVYVAVVGPNLETRAEYRFLRTIGADAVGMSTVPEVIVARHMGMRTLAISVITDLCMPDALEPITIPEILAAAARAEPALGGLVRQVLARL
ncbi:MAG: purine-nucleoside phosphorylase [Rhodothermales bacterium]|nr:purine-nucleoside phosphorylase [Rhodothermales bacterium]